VDEEKAVNSPTNGKAPGTKRAGGGRVGKRIIETFREQVSLGQSQEKQELANS